MGSRPQLSVQMSMTLFVMNSRAREAAKPRSGPESAPPPAPSPARAAPPPAARSRSALATVHAAAARAGYLHRTHACKF